MRLSKQLYSLEITDGWKAVYSPFGHKVAFIYDEAWEQLHQRRTEQINEKMLDYLTQCNIWVDEDFESRWRQQQRELASKEVRFNSMFLVTTQECNFACGYCAVMENFDHAERRDEAMSIEVGRQSVDFFQRQLAVSGSQDARVTFYGGEPMLNQQLLIDLVPRIRAMHYPGQRKPVEIIMITNGYLYNQDLTDSFREHGVGVCVSLDGKRRHQDVTRVTTGTAEKTYDRVIENYRRYQDAGLSMGISTALGRHNVFDLPEISEFYAEELQAKFVEFQLPYQVANESNQFYVAAAEAASYLMRAYEVLGARNVIEGTTHRRLRDFADGRIRFRDCGASASQLVVAPDGMIGPCHSLVGSRTFFAGNVTDPSCAPGTMDNFKQWAERIPLNMELCSDCPFISLCGGGCIYNGYVSRGSIWNKDPQVCDYLQVMVDWILQDLWESTGMAAKYGPANVSTHQEEECHG